MNILLELHFLIRFKTVLKIGAKNWASCISCCQKNCSEQARFVRMIHTSKVNGPCIHLYLAVNENCNVSTCIHELASYQTRKTKRFLIQHQ